jgi:hypothetical protein
MAVGWDHRYGADVPSWFKRPDQTLPVLYLANFKEGTEYGWIPYLTLPYLALFMSLDRAFPSDLP